MAGREKQAYPGCPAVQKSGRVGTGLLIEYSASPWSWTEALCKALAELEGLRKSLKSLQMLTAPTEPEMLPMVAFLKLAVLRVLLERLTQGSFQELDEALLPPPPSPSSRAPPSLGSCSLPPPPEERGPHILRTIDFLSSTAAAAGTALSLWARGVTGGFPQLSAAREEQRWGRKIAAQRG